VILDAVTAAEEHNDLLLEIPLEEGEKEEEPLVAVTDDIALLEACNRAMLFLVIDIY